MERELRYDVVVAGGGSAGGAAAGGFGADDLVYGNLHHADIDAAGDHRFVQNFVQNLEIGIISV